MTEAHRRDVLLGLATSAASVAAPGIAGASAVVRMEPPPEGALSIAAVGMVLQQHKVSGVSLAIIEKGALTATYGYGSAQPQAERPVTPQTQFQAASISKTVNALAVLKLVQSGRIRLDDPVNAHLQSWKLPGNALTDAMPVTIRMLLSHTGGTTVSGFWGYARTAPIPTLIEILDGKPPANSAPVTVDQPPGQLFRYSGGGTTVLQQMILDLTGEDYPSALRRLVLDPLGMRESSFVQPPASDTVEHAALGCTEDGTLTPGGFTIHPEMAAAGLWTTARDLSRVVSAIIHSCAGEPGGFLDQGLAREMLTPVSEGSGLGVFVDKKGVFSHTGGNVGYRCVHVGNALTGHGMVAMTNSNSGEIIHDELHRRVAAAYGWP
jgi:CubicO group peptidase (beta-lactamase class C family)